MEKTIAGWLIIHTEVKNHTSFELKFGKNIIGRKTPNFIGDVAIDDPFVSRRHAVIVVQLNKYNIYEYYIIDNKEVNDGKPSLNGTFVNGNLNRLENEPLRIIDGDTIQIGETKLVLKTSDINIDVEEAVKLVKRQEFQTTVDFHKQAVLKRRPKK